MVTSLRTPRPASTIPARMRLFRPAPVVSRDRARLSSLPRPLRWAAAVAQAARAAVTQIPARVPSRAVVVLVENPWARPPPGAERTRRCPRALWRLAARCGQDAARRHWPPRNRSRRRC